MRNSMTRYWFTTFHTKSLRDRFDKINGFIKLYDGTRYLGFIDPENYDAISHNYARIKVDSHDSLPPQKTLTFHNDIMHIKSVWNKDQSHYCYNKFLEKCSYQLAKK